MNAPSESQLTAEQAEAVDALAAGVSRALAAGVPASEVASELAAGGCPPDAADELAGLARREADEGAPKAAPAAQAPVAPPAARDELRDRYARKMLFGFLWAAGGAIVTAISYGAVSSTASGGRYVVAYGAILYGLVQLAIGYDGWSKTR